MKSLLLIGSLIGPIVNKKLSELKKKVALGYLAHLFVSSLFTILLISITIFTMNSLDQFNEPLSDLISSNSNSALIAFSIITLIVALSFYFLLRKRRSKNSTAEQIILVADYFLSKYQESNYQNRDEEIKKLRESNRMLKEAVLLLKENIDENNLRKSTIMSDVKDHKQDFNEFTVDIKRA